MRMERSGISWSSGFATVAMACCAFMLAIALSCYLAPCAFAEGNASNSDDDSTPSAVSSATPSAEQGDKAPSPGAGASGSNNPVAAVGSTATESPVALASPSGATEAASPVAVNDSPSVVDSSAPANPATPESGVDSSSSADVADVASSSSSKDAESPAAPANLAGSSDSATPVSPANGPSQAVSDNAGDQSVSDHPIDAMNQAGAGRSSGAAASNGRKIAKSLVTVCDTGDQSCLQGSNPNAISSIDANQSIAYAMYIPSVKRLVFGRCLPCDIRNWGNEIVLFTGFEGATYNIAAEVPWIMLAGIVSDIEFISDIAPISTAYWFASFSRLVTFDANSHLNMSKAVSAMGMFAGCASLRSVNMEGWDVGNLTQVDNMFDGCSQLSEVKGFDATIRSLHSSGHTVSGLNALRQFGVEHKLTGSFGGTGNWSDNGSDMPDDSGTTNEEGAGGDNQNGGHNDASNGGQLSEPSTVVSDGSDDVAENGLGTAIASDPDTGQPSDNLDANSKSSEKTKDRQAANTLSNRSSVFVTSNDAAYSGVATDDAIPVAPFGLNVGAGDPALNPEQAAEQAALIMAGTAEYASKMAKSAYDSCRSSLANAVPTIGEVLSHAVPDNPFAPFIAGAGIVCAAALMAAFALKIG